jgi:hypothetical protein
VASTVLALPQPSMPAHPPRHLPVRVGVDTMPTGVALNGGPARRRRGTLRRSARALLSVVRASLVVPLRPSAAAATGTSVVRVPGADVATSPIWNKLCAQCGRRRNPPRCQASEHDSRSSWRRNRWFGIRA